MTRPYYTARHAIVWLNDTLPHTIKGAEEALAGFVELALTEKDAAYSAEWAGHLAPLIAAIREAKDQERAAPVEAPRLHPIIAECFPHLAQKDAA